jgi:Na+-transporting NADH:ubiquinone oxidoreductase subunit NqrC
VDAISGATITCDGVHKMIATNLSEYAAFLNEDVEPINTEEE